MEKDSPSVPVKPWSAPPVSRRKFMALTAAFSAMGVIGLPSAGGIELAPLAKEPPDLKVPGPPRKKIGWAVVGLGELALGEVLPAFALCERSAPVALVSGHYDKALKVAEHYGIDKQKIYNYENYDGKLRNDPAVQAVYIILPNSLHAEYTIRAFQAGKHVLCEKPMAVNQAECRRMIEASGEARRKLMVAYRLRYEPFNQKMIEIARKGVYGKIRLIEASNVQNVQAPNIRLSKALGGGPLGDVGIYCLNACRYLTGEEPVEVFGMLTRPADDPRFAEVEDRVIFGLKFPSGVLAHCDAGFSAESVRRYRVMSERGWFGLDPAFAYSGLEAHVSTPGGREKLNLKQVNHFSSEMDYFSKAIEDDEAVLTPGEDGLKDLRVIEAIYQSAGEGRVVKL